MEEIENLCLEAISKGHDRFAGILGYVRDHRKVPMRKVDRAMQRLRRRGDAVFDRASWSWKRRVPLQK